MSKQTTVSIAVLVFVVLAGVFFFMRNSINAPTGSNDYSVEIKNVSEDQTISPGILVVHDSSFSMNYNQQESPREFEPLAEVGDPKSIMKKLRGMKGVNGVYSNNTPILPGESQTISVVGNQEDVLSAAFMLVQTNDGYAFVDALPLTNETPGFAQNYDNGTEQNSELGSGFEGGQPDPSRGSANVENGEATDPKDVVTEHDQVTGFTVELTVSEL